MSLTNYTQPLCSNTRRQHCYYPSGLRVLQNSHTGTACPQNLQNIASLAIERQALRISCKPIAWQRILDAALSTVMPALRSNISTALNGSPGALTFNRDMFVNIPLIADWHLITTNREQFVNESLRRSNAKRRRYDYTPGMRVLKKLHKPTKLGNRTSGPYNITQVHVNGTVTILLRPGVTERINIRRVIPYRT